MASDDTFLEHAGPAVLNVKATCSPDSCHTRHINMLETWRISPRHSQRAHGPSLFRTFDLKHENELPADNFLFHYLMEIWHKTNYELTMQIIINKFPLSYPYIKLTEISVKTSNMKYNIHMPTMQAKYLLYGNIFWLRSINFHIFFSHIFKIFTKKDIE